MTGDEKAALAVLLVLLVAILLPLCWVTVVFPPEPYHVLAGEPVRAAAEDVLLSVRHENETTWSLHGAMGGKTYILEDEAGNRLVVRTQAFDSAESRDAAVRAFSGHLPGRGRPAGTLIVVGNHVILTGPDPGGILARITPSIKMNRVGG